MNTLRTAIYCLTASVIISSCQKEVNFENIIAEAHGSLPKTASGDCTPVVLGGTYVQNTAMGSSNYMDVQVNVLSAGDYEVKTDTVNGYSFKATGHAGSTGLQTVRLAASGTPVLAGTNGFIIRFDTSTCHTNVVVSAAAAQYTFGSTAGVCTATIGGTYTTGVALGSANNVAIQVNVSLIGSYSITTNTVNGMTFSYSGTFTSTGTQTVTLAGSGTPSAAGSFTFNTATTGGCTFVIPVTAPAINLPQLTTTAASNVLCSSAVSGGNITSDGGATVTTRGICYGLTANPTLANTVVSTGSGTGIFTCNMVALNPGTTYHVRAFATNSAGTAYGNDISFTTTTGCTISIFVTGWHDVFNISGNIRTPKLWINTTGAFNGTSLPFTLNAGAVEGNSVFVSGTDVYVAGTQNGTATLWKNGIKNELSPAQSFGYGNSVYVSGTDVYVAGSESSHATLWKNGAPTTLSTGPLGSMAQGVFVSGSDVYVVGYTTEMVGSNVAYVATLWKNGVATPLASSATTDVNAYSVFVSGTDVYIVGKQANAAKLWKNGVATTLSVAAGNTGVANSVFVSGTDVYVAGIEYDGASINSYAKLWKNGTGTLLTTSGYHNAANCVVVNGTDVFVAGAKSTGGANTYAGMWRNGFFTPTDGGSTDAAAYGVFVK